MRKKQTGFGLLGLSAVSFLIMAVSFLLMPIADIGIFPGLIFWMGLLLGIVLQIALDMQRRRFFKAHNGDWKKMQKSRCGFLTFGSNRYARKIDVALAACLFLSVIVLCVTKGFGYICYICISCTSFLFCMHCIVNGRNFAYVIYDDSARKTTTVNRRSFAGRRWIRKKKGLFEK